MSRAILLTLLLLSPHASHAMSSAPPGCGPNGASCGSDEFCFFAEGCGEDGAPGECRPIPQVCTMEYAPVCGCDGQTHPNGCAAHGAGTSIQRAGACAPDPSAQ